MSTLTIGTDARVLQAEARTLGWSDEGRAAMEMWRPHLDQLRAWLAEPALLDEEDVTPPTAITIRNALWLALAMSERMFAPPLRVLPVPSGAIALERFTGDQLVRIELREDSDTVELFVFQGSQLITRALMRIDDVLIGATP